jgi:predicted PurR-regulated permease PerM
MTPLEARRAALGWGTLTLVGLSVVVLWPLWPPLVMAAWTAGLMRPLQVRFERGLHGRRRAGALLSLLLFVVLGLPLTLMALGVGSGAVEVLATLRSSPSARSALEALLSSPEEALPLPSTLSEFMSLAMRSGAMGLDVLSLVAGAALTGLVGLMIYFAGAYTLLVDSEEVWAWWRARAPLSPRVLDRLSSAFHETGRGLLIGVGLTALCQGVVASIIYAALGVPRAWVLGPMTGIASMIPFVGTGLVWAPIALGLFFTGRPTQGIILVLLGVVVISSVDNVLRPVFSRWSALKLPVFLLFVAAFGGLAVFGTWGALIGPLILRMTMEALTLLTEPDEEAPLG